MFARHKIPNLLTFARVLAVPVALGVILYNPHYTQILFWLFALAALTDFFDGYLARKWNAESRLGKLLDPMADKLLVALLLIYFVALQQLSLVPVVLILLRELYIAGLREFLAGRHITLPVSQGGKWKTAVQMIAILLLLFSLAYTAPQLWGIGTALLWVAAALAVLSAADYTRKAWPNLN